MLKKFYWPLLYCRNSREKIFFFKQNFSTNQNSRKMKFIYLIFFSFRSRDQWTLMLKKFYWPMLYSRNPREKIFFFHKIFRPIRIREEWNSFIWFFSRSDRETAWTLMLKKFYWPLLYCRNSREKIFFFEKFLDQSRKNKFQFFHFFSIGIHRPVDTDAQKNSIDLCCIVDSREKNFFLFSLNFSINQNSKFNYSIFCSFDRVNTDTKKVLMTFAVLSKFARKIIFSSKFFHQSEFEKNEIHLFDFLLVRIERPMNTDAKKVLMTFVVLSKFAWKNFFFLQNFSPNRNWRKNRIPLFDFLLIGNERPMNTDTKKILLTFVVMSKFARKNFFFSSKFFDQSEFEKNEIHLFDFLLVRFERPMNTDAKKILLTSVVLSKSGRKKFFFLQNFSTNQRSRKNRIQLFVFLLIGIERPMTTGAKKILFTFVVLSKLARKIFFFLEIFRPIRIREKIEFHYSIFFSLESRDQWTLMLKKYLWPLLYCRNSREKIFFFTKFFDQSEFEKKSNSIIRFFTHWNRETNEHWC